MQAPLPKLERFHVLGRLATGRVADVWLARVRGGFESLVVIKTVHPHLVADPTFVSRFIDEGRMAVRLNHPNCVQVYELVQESGLFFCSMEFEGFSLARVLERATKKNLPLPERVLARIAMDAASGLEHAHTHLQLVHGDVSAENVLVSFEGQTRLANFGIARAMTRLKGQHDARADLIALGAMLHRALPDSALEGARFESAGAMREAIEAALRAAEPEDVAEYMSQLWPAGDADRAPRVPKFADAPTPAHSWS